MGKGQNYKDQDLHRFAACSASIRGILAGLWYALNFISCKTLYGVLSLPWVPEVFLACDENFRCWPKVEATSGHYKDLYRNRKPR